jgi:hypothetical protein
MGKQLVKSLTSSNKDLSSNSRWLNRHLLQHRFKDIFPKLGQFVILQVHLGIRKITCKRVKVNRNILGL